MKLLKLHIDNFGTLRDYDYTFCDGLNVFREDNGWGKSTMAAFLKAMLYGFGTKRSRDITENERKRYLPWQGGKYGGSLDFEAGGSCYRVFRTFGETPAKDRTRIIDLNSGATARIDPEKLGETLFGLDANAFQRSIFIRQNGLEIADAAGSLHARLNALVSQANDAGAFEGAVKSLTEQIKQYERMGNRGELPEITRQIAEQEQKRRILEADVASQEAARERIIALDRQVEALDVKLAEQKKLLDEVSGESKKREAAQEQIEQLTAQRNEIAETQKKLLQELGGSLPSAQASEQAHKDRQSAETFTEQQRQLTETGERLRSEIQELQTKYHGKMPTSAQLDAVQDAYSEWQGVLGTGEEPVDPGSAPPEYLVIQKAAEADPQYPEKLRLAAGQRTKLQALQQTAEKLRTQIQTESESFAEHHKRYADLNAEVSGLEQNLEKQNIYRPEQTEPAVKTLEYAEQKRTQIAAKTEELQNALQRAGTEWEQLRTLYAQLQQEAAELRSQAEEQFSYRPEQTDSVIKGCSTIVKNRSDLQNKCSQLRAKMDAAAQRWEDKQNRFAALQEEQKQAKSALEEQSDYAPQKVAPAIKALEESQKLAQLGAAKEQEMAAGQLNDEQQAMLAAFSGNLPDPAEGSRMLNLCRKAAADASDMQGLQARLDGERSKAESLRLSVGQIEVGETETPPEEPGADRSTLFFAVGAVLILLGILLAVLINPVLAALAAVGIVVIVLGVSNKTKSRTAAEAFAAYQEREAKRQEAAAKKAAMQQQLTECENASDSLQKQITDKQTAWNADRETVKRWLAMWMPDIREPQESDIIALLDKTGIVRSLRERQESLRKLQAERDSLRLREQEQRSIADTAFPDMTGKSAAEMLEALRAGETEFRIREKQASAAEKAVSVFLKSEKLTLEQLEETRSPEQSALEQALRGAEEQLAHADDSRAAWEKTFPEITGLSEEDAAALLRKKQNAYQVCLGQQQTAENAVRAFLKSTKRTENDLQSETSPDIPKLEKQLADTKQQAAAIENDVQKILEMFPELQGKSTEYAVTFLRERLREYQVADGQLRTAQQAKQKFLKACRFKEHELKADALPQLAKLTAEQDTAVQQAENIRREAAPLLTIAGADTSLPVPQQMEQAERMLGIYRNYSEKLAEQQNRQQKRREQISARKAAFDKNASVLQGLYPDEELSVRIAHIREDIARASGLAGKQKENRSAQERTAESLRRVQKSLDAYIAKHTGFEPDAEDILAQIDRRAEEYRKLEAAAAALEQQKKEVLAKMDTPAQRAADAKENDLRREIIEMENQRDALLTEYTRTGEQIRNADRSLEQFADTEILIRELYEKKEHIRNDLAVLQRAKSLIQKAKENLAERYLGKVEQCFNRYMQLWLENPALSGILDTDFNVSISENGASHVAEGYSTGYCDLIDFCMRLALVDTLFEQEQPFLILDDPFVNLDDVRTEKALELLRMMSETRQMIYFVCHPIRAVETAADSGTRAKFLQLAEAAKTTITAQAQSSRRSVRRNPRELYTVTGALPEIVPVRRDLRITNRIFSMDFMQNPQTSGRDKSYELFFIDEKGRLLGERRMIEIKDGELSQQRIQFCLNTREDSGTQFELMLRESGQGDYEIAARFPYTAKLDVGISLDDF